MEAMEAIKPSSHQAILTAMLAFGVALGCSKTDSDQEAGEEETGTECLPVDDDSPCICADSELLAWGCQCFYDPPGPAEYWGNPAICAEPNINEIGYVCGADYSDGYDACGDLCGDQLVEYAIDFRINPDGTPVPCVDNAASMSCGSWDPGSEITYNSGPDNYSMDWTFISGLVANPEPLWACDNATFEPLAGGGFEVSNANSGEFLYELGLRNDDEILSINDIDIENYADAGMAFIELWGETAFTLEVKRGAGTIELDYVITPLLRCFSGLR